VTIRRAVRSDFAAITRLMCWAAEETAATFAASGDSETTWIARWEATRDQYPWFVAEDDGVFAGFATAGPYRTREAYAWTVESSVYVHPDHHRRGIARGLYERLIDTLRRQGYHTLVACLSVPNEASEALHDSLGMKKVGVLARMGWKFEQFYDVAFYLLLLQPTQEEDRPLTIRRISELLEGE